MPAATVARLVPQLIAYGHVKWAGLGVQVMPDHIAAQWGIEGVVVREVLPDSPAAHAGLRSMQVDWLGNARAFDVITKVQGQPVTSLVDLIDVIDDYEPGDTVELEFVRGGRERLGASPARRSLLAQPPLPNPNSEGGPSPCPSPISPCRQGRHRHRRQPWHRPLHRDRPRRERRRRRNRRAQARGARRGRRGGGGHRPPRASACPPTCAASRSCANLVDETVAQLGRVDVLVNNAGTNPVYGPVQDIDERAWDTIMNTNVKAMHFLSNFAREAMLRHGEGGAIVNVSSVGGFQATDVIGGYSVSKAALNMLTQVQAKTWGADGIRVNCIAPGLIQTEFARALWDNREVPQGLGEGGGAAPHRPARRDGRAPRSTSPAPPRPSSPARP